MSFSELPDVALIKIFRTFEHLELMRVYQTCRHSQRLQGLIEHSSSLWMSIHLQSTVDYHLWTNFIRLLVLNASKTRQLIIDQLDLTCRKILVENHFSLRDFTQLDLLIIHDQYLCNSLQSVQFCSTTLKTLCLTNEHTNLKHWNHLNSLENLQMNLYSMDILQNQFEYLTNLHLKIMFDHDHQSTQIFTRLPRISLQILTLKFLILNNDLHFNEQFHLYLDYCQHLHTLELHHLHGMCPMSIYSDFDYSKYQRMILENIVPLKEMKNFLEFHQYDLPLEYLQINSMTNMNQYSSRIQTQNWCDREVIVIDYLSCVTTSMDLFDQFNVIWSDKQQRTQSFESYILRSIYNLSNIIQSLRHFSISKFELSLNGLNTLMMNLTNAREMIITDGRIDQMGAGMLDIEKIIRTTTTNVSQSDIRIITMNNIQLSRRMIVLFCLITSRLNSLILNDIQILDRQINLSSSENQSNLLVILKQIAQLTEQFRWNDMKSLTFGKNLLNRTHLFSFIPSNIQNIYARNLNHLRFIIHDQTLLEPQDVFSRSMKKFTRNFPQLTSFVLEFTQRYEGQCRLRNHLHTVFESITEHRVYTYPTIHDRACRFCFDVNASRDEEQDDDDDEDRITTSQRYRTFCGIPLFQMKKNQRKSNIVS